MYEQHLPIWRDANRLLLEIEQAVRHFPRYHKYTLGGEMRSQAMRVSRLVHRAWYDKPNQPAHLGRLILAVDDLKLQIHLAKELQAFRNFAEFQRIAEQAVNVGKQCGGWRRRALKRQPEPAANGRGAC